MPVMMPQNQNGGFLGLGPQAGGALSGAGTGAAIGGPWGAAAGGALGLIGASGSPQVPPVQSAVDRRIMNLQPGGY